ncbi:hypothetical protein [Vibrio stylophorae]|uniref:hypothetical protein n=1 Tax=Vibrio stylophorae TaxID=659351 RepID=UPI001F2BC3B8|nr:hypothetical protein [Vibrio stylophorae]
MSRDLENIEQRMLKQSPVVTGSPEFVAQVRHALFMIAQQSPQHYRYITQNIGAIVEHDKSGMDVMHRPMTFYMSDVTAFHSLYWCAGTIVHDAYHAYLYKQAQSQYGASVPYSAWGGTQAEVAAIAVQRDALVALKAPRYMLDYLAGLDGTHGDVDGDGAISWHDYQARTW